MDDEFIGRYLGDILPSFKSFLYHYLNRTKITKEKQEFNVYCYKGTKLIFVFDVAMAYENEQIVIVSRAIDIVKDNDYRNSSITKISIIQDDKFVKLNDAFKAYLNRKGFDSDNFKLEYLKENALILDNSTHQELTLAEIFKKTIDVKSDNIIDFSFKVDDFKDTLYGISRRVTYNHRAAIEFSIISGYNLMDSQELLLDFEEKIHTFNQKNKTTFFAVYDNINTKFFWSEEVYDLLKIHPTVGDDRKNIMKDFVLSSDLHLINEAHAKISYRNPEVEYNYRILLDGRLKHINCTAFAIYETKRKYPDRILYTLKDITEEYKFNKNLSLLEENLNMVQEMTKSAIYYKNYENEYTWTPEIYNILECDDIDSTENIDLLDEFVIYEDQEKLKEEKAKLTPENPEIRFEIMIRTKKLNLKYLEINERREYDELGEEVSKVISCHDITDKKEMEEENLKILNAFNDVGAHLKTAIFLRDRNNDYIFSEVFSDIVGMETKNWFKGKRCEFVKNIKNREEYIKFSKKFEKNEIDEIDIILEYYYGGDSNNIKNIQYYMHRSKMGNVAGYVSDITEIISNEKQLKITNNEKDILIKEIHHRVKNNLQIMSSLINLEERFYKDDPARIISSTKQRINSMSLIHEMTYKSKNLETVNLKDYFEKFDKTIFGNHITETLIFENDIDENIYLPLNIVTPLILIINELSSNSMKYAFNLEDDSLNIIKKTIKEEDCYCIIEFQDNGEGIEEDFDMNNTSGLGWQIILSLVSQIDGELEQIKDKSAHFKLKFKMPEI